MKLFQNDNRKQNAFHKIKYPAIISVLLERKKDITINKEVIKKKEKASIKIEHIRKSNYSCVSNQDNVERNNQKKLCENEMKLKRKKKNKKFLKRRNAVK